MSSGRGLRVVTEVENIRLGSDSMRRLTSVDLPEPDGAEMMNTIDMDLRLFQILRLLAYFLDMLLQAQADFGERQAAPAQRRGFREHRVRLPVQLLR